jgi:hypothetical protein
MIKGQKLINNNKNIQKDDLIYIYIYRLEKTAKY